MFRLEEVVMLSRALLPCTPLVAAIAAITLLSPLALAQDDTYRGPGAVNSPGTYEGSRAIQEQEQQQDRQYREQQQEQFDQGLQQQQRENQQNQQYYGQPGGYGGGQATSNGPFGAMYLDPANPGGTTRTSYNYPSPATARAAAMGACHQAAGRPCKDVLEFHNACAAMAHGRNGVWAARAAGSAYAARVDAILACRKSGGQACVPGTAFCSPNND